MMERNQWTLLARRYAAEDKPALHTRRLDASGKASMMDPDPDSSQWQVSYGGIPIARVSRYVHADEHTHWNATYRVGPGRDAWLQLPRCYPTKGHATDAALGAVYELGRRYQMLRDHSVPKCERYGPHGPWRGPGLD